MRSSFTFLLAFALTAASAAAQTHTSKTFDIYVLDVEGGGSTLFVSPSGESVLVDTASGGPNFRDVNRIMDAVHDAGLTQIDNLITTHWHLDHFGGMKELATRIPIKNFIDHGPEQEGNVDSIEFAKIYPSIIADSKHTVAKPGDKIPVAGLDWRIVTSAGEAIKTPLPGGGIPNPYCADFKPKAKDDDGGYENTMSVGSVITYGKFRMVHLGDLTWNREFELMCPVNRIGTVDLWIVSHHGLSKSSSESLVYALHPRVEIMNNGTRKGGEPVTMKTLLSSPGLEDLWQIHFSVLSGQEYTVPGLFIANVFDNPIDAMPIAAQPLPPPRAPGAPVHNGKAYWIKVSAQADGTFTVTNPRTQFSKTYAARTQPQSR